MSSAMTTSKVLLAPTSFRLRVSTSFHPLLLSRHSWHRKAQVHLSRQPRRVLNSPTRPMQCRTTIPILKISTTDPRTTPGTAFPRHLSSTLPCSSLPPPKAPLQRNKEMYSQTTTAAVYTVVSTNTSQAMTICTSTSSIMHQAWAVWAGNTSTRNCTVTRVSKASWGSAKVTTRRRDRRLGNVALEGPLRRLTNHTHKTSVSRTAHRALGSVSANLKEDAGACNKAMVKAVASTATVSGRLLQVVDPMGSTSNTSISKLRSRVVPRRAT